MNQPYNLKNIYALLLEGFSETELLQLCFETRGLKDIAENWSRISDRSELARFIVDSAQRRLVLDGVLEWAADHNPRRHAIHGPYYEPEAQEGAGLIISGGSAAFILADSDLGYGLRLGGMYQNSSLRLVASPWTEYANGWVRSGWLFAPSWKVNHAVSFFKLHISSDGNGFIHLLGASEPDHTLRFTSEAGFNREEAFHYQTHPAAFWRFVWRKK